MSPQPLLERFPFLAPRLPSERPALVAIAEAAGHRLAVDLDRLSAEEQVWLASTPLSNSVRIVDAYRRGPDCTVAAPGVRALEGELKAFGGDAWAAAYSRLLIASLLARLPTVQPPFAIPECVWPAIEVGLRSLLDALADGYGFASWEESAFVFDLGAAQFRTAPHAGMVTHMRLVRPASNARHAPLRERLALMRYLGRDYRHRCWYTNAHVWRGYREMGRLDWRVRFEQTAALFAVNPEWRGQAAAGWFVDPAVAAISPGVAAKFTGLTALGAKTYRMPNNTDTVRLALFASDKRRALHESGTYRPQTYGNIISRADSLRWAEGIWEARARGEDPGF